MVFAGFWTTVAPEDEIAYVIATTRPNEIVAPIHDRMPVILADDRVAEWVDSAGPLPDRTGKWAEPFPSDLMLSWPVSRRVNDVRNDDIGCTAPLPPATGASCGDLFETQS